MAALTAAAILGAGLFTAGVQAVVAEDQSKQNKALLDQQKADADALIAQEAQQKAKVKAEEQKAQNILIRDSQRSALRAGGQNRNSTILTSPTGVSGLGNPSGGYKTVLGS